MKTLLLFLCVLVSVRIFGQPQSAASGERVQLITDRTLYVSGENLQFAAALLKGNDTLKSKVLYAEIVSPDGTRVCGAKFPIEGGFAQGKLLIPQELISGTYYCRAYTRAMRNEGPAVYPYNRIKIVNPTRKEVQSGTLVENNPLDSLMIDEKAFDIQLNKRSYAPGDTMRLSVKARNGKSFTLLGVSLIPENTAARQEKVVPIIPGHENARYFPDTRGISISGKVLDPRNRQPLPGVRVYLSILGSQKDFMAIRTDSLGIFNFSLPPFTGNHDLFICSENRQGNPPLIYIDNDFCTQAVSLPAPVFTLDEKEREAALKLAVNLQLQSLFGPDSLIAEVLPQGAPFYGKPDDVIYLDQYVQLPEMEEYFNELPTRVKVRKRYGHPYFKLTGTESGLDIYEPLVLVDWVAVDDPVKVLAINPRQVERIEVITKPYVKGEQTFGGIISILSKQGDFAGMDLPSSGLFLNYQFFEKPAEPQPVPQSKNMPDARNTLFFKGVKGGKFIIEDVVFPKEVRGNILKVLGFEEGGEIMVTEAELQ
ncbi:MAG: hypothetical protein IPH88_16300 [Bacteroidales bacterium]|nr:hypothetical protein [Bacteroidales bacterium]